MSNKLSRLSKAWYNLSLECRELGSLMEDPLRTLSREDGINWLNQVEAFQDRLTLVRKETFELIWEVT